jgi:hypothetical protein
LLHTLFPVLCAGKLVDEQDLATESNVWDSSRMSFNVHDNRWGETSCSYAPGCTVTGTHFPTMTFSLVRDEKKKQEAVPYLSQLWCGWLCLSRGIVMLCRRDLLYLANRLSPCNLSRTFSLADKPLEVSSQRGLLTSSTHPLTSEAASADVDEGGSSALGVPNRRTRFADSNVQE